MDERSEPQWTFGRFVVAIAGISVFAAAVAGLALLSWGLQRSGGGVAQAQPTATPVSASPSPTPIGSNAPNLLLRDFWMVDANNGWMGGASRGCQDGTPDCVGVIFHTSNGGDTWTEQYSGNVQVTALAFDGQLGFAIGPTGPCDTNACTSGILRTTDGGLNWAEVVIPLQLTHLTVLGTEVWILARGCTPDEVPCTGGSQLIASKDSGDTFSKVPLPDGVLPADLSHPTAADAWIVTSPAGPGTARVIVTHDSGATWQDLPSPENGAGFEQRIFFRSATEGWLVIASQPGAGSQPKEVFSTTDGGQTWTHLTGSLAPPGTGQPDSGLPIGGYLGQIVFTSDVDGWMASPRAGLLHTTDGGTTWSLALQDDNLSGVQFSDPEQGWALSLVALWRTADGGATWQSGPPSDAANP